MDKLIKQRDKAIGKLRELAEQILIGSATETYRTCGNPTCRCHSTGPKHGPHMYVAYRGETKKTTGYYVPKAFHKKVRTSLAAWKKFQETARQVAQLNKEILDAEKATKAAEKKKK